MAIFGIGAYYEGTTDMTEEFVQNGRACIGWGEDYAPTLHQMMRQVRVGDLIYIKSFTPRAGLTIKAVGIVISTEIEGPEIELGEICIEVDWAWQGYHPVGRVNDKYNVRSITLYEEFNPEIQNLIIDALRGRNVIGTQSGILL